MKKVIRVKAQCRFMEDKKGSVVTCVHSKQVQDALFFVNNRRGETFLTTTLKCSTCVFRELVQVDADTGATLEGLTNYLNELEETKNEQTWKI